MSITLLAMAPVMRRRHSFFLEQRLDELAPTRIITAEEPAYAEENARYHAALCVFVNNKSLFDTPYREDVWMGARYARKAGIPHEYVGWRSKDDKEWLANKRRLLEKRQACAEPTRGHWRHRYTIDLEEQLVVAMYANHEHEGLLKWGSWPKKGFWDVFDREKELLIEHIGNGLHGTRKALEARLRSLPKEEDVAILVSTYQTWESTLGLTLYSRIKDLGPRVVQLRQP